MLALGLKAWGGVRALALGMNAWVCYGCSLWAIHVSEVHACMRVTWSVPPLVCPIAFHRSNHSDSPRSHPCPPK